jgi:hypothetical protein
MTIPDTLFIERASLWPQGINVSLVSSNEELIERNGSFHPEADRVAAIVERDVLGCRH